MDLTQLLRALSRAPWLAAGRLLLKAAGYTPHRGYEDSVAEALKEPPDAVRRDRLEQLLREHAVAGEKLVRLIKLEQGERALIHDWIAGKRKTSNALTDAFPANAADADIKSMSGQAPSSVGSIELEQGRAAVFTSVRSYLDRIPLSANQLKAGVNEGFEEIYALRRVFRQAYDAVWLPAGLDVVCLATDLPSAAPSGYAKEAQVALEAHVRKVLNRSIVPINLWPAVSALYHSGEGRLVDYGFVNNADAVKHHAGRRGGKCLREDVYDKAGAAAVGDDLQLFKIAIAWSRGEEYSVKAQPELILPGQSRTLSAPVRKLEHGIVRNCLNSRDLAFVVSRLLKHLA